MNPNCIAAVTAAAGKALTPAKIKAIEDALEGKMRELARQDRTAWLAKGPDQQMMEAAVAAANDIRTAAKLKEYRGGLQVLAAANIQTRVASNMQTTKSTTSQAYAHDLVQTGLQIEAIRDSAISTLADTLKAVESTDGTGLMRGLAMRVFSIDNPQMTADVVREVFANADGSTGNKAAQAGARAWLDTAEALRQRFNSLGGDIGKLGYGYLTQAHDAALVWKAGADTWAAKTLPKLDRSQYLNPNGTPMNDSQMMELLRAAHRTISEEGDNNRAAGQYRGSGATANHGNQSRVLHFKDGDAWMEYMADFGRGGLYDSMMGHVGAMSRDIGLMERMGPNATQTHRLMVDLADRADRHAGFFAKRSFGGKPDNYFRILTGEANVTDSPGLASAMRELRAAQVAAKLGSTLWTAVGGDIGTTLATLHYHRLPYFEMLKNARNLRGEDAKNTLIAHSIINDAIGRGFNRFIDEHLSNGLGSMLANATMKLTWVQAWTGALHDALQVTLAGGVARSAKRGWMELDQWDRHLFERAGFTAEDWAVLQQVTPTADFGGAHLTAKAVRDSGIEGAQTVAEKLGGFLKDESHFAAVAVDLDTRSVVTAGGTLKPGTPSGEILRSVAQFHSFPTAMVSRHLRRIWDTPQGLQGAPLGYGAEYGNPTVNRLAVTAAFTVALALTASIGLQIKQIILGKDPLDMTDPKFWQKAAAMGGGLSYLGDFLTRDPVDQRTFGFERYMGLAGPLAGTAGGVVDLTFGNAYDLAKGRNPNAAAEALGFANRNMPLVNMWQTRAAWEHWFLFYAQENLNPGYLARMQRRAQKDFGQGYFWAPGEAAPDRAPDFGNMIGE